MDVDGTTSVAGEGEREQGSLTVVGVFPCKST